MLPTLNVKGDCTYVSKFNRRGKGVVVGDVVSFKHPMFPGVGASKRVLGMPGDFVIRGEGDGSERLGEEMIQVGLCGDILVFTGRRL